MNLRHEIERLRTDLRGAVRGLQRRPLLPTVTCLALGVGVGANCAVLRRADAALFQEPLGVLEAQRLVRVTSVNNYQTYLEYTRSGYPIPIALRTRAAMTLEAKGATRSAEVECVDSEYFQLLGARAEQGVTLQPATDSESEFGNQVVISRNLLPLLSDSFGESGPLGVSLSVAGKRFVVVGVMPTRFTGMGLEHTDAWIPLAAAPEACSFSGQNLLGSGDGAWLEAIGRLPAEDTLEVALQRLSAWRTQRRLPKASRTELVPLYESRIATLSSDGHIALWLAGASLVTLVISLLNVVGLMLIRGIELRHEMAIRVQLGATRSAMLRFVMAEALVLGLINAPVAIGAAAVVEHFIDPFFPTVPPDGADLAYAVTGAVALGVCLLCGVLASGTAVLGDSRSLLNSGHFVTPGGRRFQSAFITTQVAVAVMLLVSAGLFARSAAVAVEDPGYEGAEKP